MQECDRLLSAACFRQVGELLFVILQASGYWIHGHVARLIGELTTKPSVVTGRFTSEDCDRAIPVGWFAPGHARNTKVCTGIHIHISSCLSLPCAIPIHLPLFSACLPPCTFSKNQHHPAARSTGLNRARDGQFHLYSYGVSAARQRP